MSLKTASTVVFTGFRDDALRKAVESHGGRVTSAVSAKTDLLVVSGSKGVGSAKAVAARALGVRVVTREEFEEAYDNKGILAFLGRAFGAREPPAKSASVAKQTCYSNLDNGGKTFQACFNSRRFWVIKRGPNGSFPDGEVVLPPTAYSRVFVGKSPENKMTRYSGGHGPRFDGNSMLFELRAAKATAVKRKYVFVGASVRSFFAAVPIERFASPVGNSGVPYPYAVDRDGGVYFMEYHAVTLIKRPTDDISRAVAEGEDPYDGFVSFCKKTGYTSDPGWQYARMTPKQRARAKVASREDYVKKIRLAGKPFGASEAKSVVIAPRV